MRTGVQRRAATSRTGDPIISTPTGVLRVGEGGAAHLYERALAEVTSLRVRRHRRDNRIVDFEFANRAARGAQPERRRTPHVLRDRDRTGYEPDALEH